MNIPSTIVEKSTQPQFTVPHVSWTNTVSELSQNISTNLAEKKYGDALTSYAHLKELISKVVESNMDLHATFYEALQKAQEQMESTLHAMDFESTKTVEYIEQLLHLTKAEIDKHDLSTATKLYEKIVKLYHKIPVEFAEKRSQIQDDILKIYLFLKEKRKPEMRQKYNGLLEEFEKLYPQCVESLKQGNVEKTQGYIKQIEEIYYSLPPGYPLLKTTIISKIATMKNQLAYVQHVKHVHMSYEKQKEFLGDSIKHISESIEFHKDDKPLDSIPIDPAPGKYSQQFTRNVLGTYNQRSQVSGDISAYNSSLSSEDLDILEQTLHIFHPYAEPLPFVHKSKTTFLDRAAKLQERLSSVKKQFND
ncbi:MAG: hypothetical protein ACMXYA_01440 [Candidatus Woesearchaeota archaeon]